MLLWINGPFGGGKTQTAYELCRCLSDGVVCDPEQVGFGLHHMMPSALRTDFQDFPSWRQGVFEVLDYVLGKHAGPVIAPMTVVEPRYLLRWSGGCGMRDMTCVISRCRPIGTRSWIGSVIVASGSLLSCVGRAGAICCCVGSSSPWTSSATASDN